MRLNCVRAKPADCQQAVADELHQLAHDVRRIGDGYRATPEAIAIAKHDIAARLAALAREMKP